MKVTRQYQIGDVTFIITELEAKAQIIVAKKTYNVLVADLKGFAAALLGPDSPYNTLTNHALPPTADMMAAAVRRASPSDLDKRSASSSTPLRQISREEAARMDKPVQAPSNVFGGLSPVADTTQDGIKFSR